MRGFTVQDHDVFELVDRHRRRAIRYLLLLLIPVFAMLASFVVAPELTSFSVRGVPLRWLLLGPVTLFSIVIVAWRHDQYALAQEQLWAKQRHGDAQ